MDQVRRIAAVQKRSHSSSVPGRGIELADLQLAHGKELIACMSCFLSLPAAFGNSLLTIFSRQADEMGLGKTVQVVSFLNYLLTVQSVRGPFLVIEHLSTIPHWEREFTNWTEMYPIVYLGNALSRAVAKHYDVYTQDGRTRIDVLITSYEVALMESSFLSKFEWACLVLMSLFFSVKPTLWLNPALVAGGRRSAPSEEH